MSDAYLRELRQSVLDAPGNREALLGYYSALARTGNERAIQALDLIDMLQPRTIYSGETVHPERERELHLEPDGWVLIVCKRWQRSADGVVSIGWRPAVDRRDSDRRIELHRNAALEHGREAIRLSRKFGRPAGSCTRPPKGYANIRSTSRGHAIYAGLADTSGRAVVWIGPTDSVRGYEGGLTRRTQDLIVNDRVRSVLRSRWGAGADGVKPGGSLTPDDLIALWASFYRRPVEHELRALQEDLVERLITAYTKPWLEPQEVGYSNSTTATYLSPGPGEVCCVCDKRSHNYVSRADNTKVCFEHAPPYKSDGSPWLLPEGRIVRSPIGIHAVPAKEELLQWGESSDDSAPE